MLTLDAMHIPARILRATVENRHKRPEPTIRELEREDRFVAGAQTAFAEHGRNRVTVAGMARSLRTSAAMLRHCFCDLDALFAEILHRHLSSLAKAFGAIDRDDPDVFQKRRAIYLAATRTALGGLTEAHILLVRDRHLLPDDLLPAVEAHRHSIGLLLAGPLARRALHILDSPDWDAESIEETLTFQARKIAQPTQPPAAQPPAPAPAKPSPPAPPPTAPAHKEPLLPPWPHLALETQPGDPPDDLTRLGRGLSALKLTPQTFPDPPP
jgi:AcrR family transcriptional regulator